MGDMVFDDLDLGGTVPAGTAHSGIKLISDFC